MTDERPEFSRPSLAPSDEMMLRWIRDGLVDAEIAVRLGISNQEVKERIARLASRLGVRDRDGLRLPPVPIAPEPVADEEESTQYADERSRWRLLRSPVALPLVVIGVLGIGFVVWAGGDSEPTAGEEDRSDYLVSLDSRSFGDVIRAAQGVGSEVHLDPGLFTAELPETPTAELRNGKRAFNLGRLFYISRNWTSVGLVSMEGDSGAGHALR